MVAADALFGLGRLGGRDGGHKGGGDRGRGRGGGGGGGGGGGLAAYDGRVRYASQRVLVIKVELERVVKTRCYQVALYVRREQTRTRVAHANESAREWFNNSKRV